MADEEDNDIESARHRRTRKQEHDAAIPRKLDYGSELVALQIEYGIPKALVHRTDAEWAEIDAQVAKEKAAHAALTREPPRAEHAHLERYTSIGWPLRALLHAEKSGNPNIVGVVDARRNIAILAGDHGTGKTVASAAWMLHTKTPAHFMTAFAFSTASRFDEVARERIASMAALVLDDLGAEHMDSKGSLSANLDELIDIFYGSMRPLIISTNLAKEPFKKRYGARIADRFREAARWIVVTGESRRQPR